ncbi:aspartate/glutamate racemase family protein [Costertonia aggregata]|uniref:Aspartate/glutamate racemase family protein n=1 Tax=Costertonia aggregata TaxID=343403 RepID=A0A7H9AMQ8_9FLAO|nr:aspartate/glutamate racemase family protein [Costertonia aggregata]QLG44707.1 aspartate/glutamate racemase family protein [Costertonia aggregata]
MKKIGLIGGMSWESTQVYYRIINQLTREIKGGHHSANCIIDSLDFAEVEKFQSSNNWQSLNEMMAKSAKNLELAGAECLVLCTNTMHLCSPSIISQTNIPFLHIAEETGKAISEKGLKKVLLLGTDFTMKSRFYSKILNENFGIEVCIPNNEDRIIIHRIIYEELVFGIFTIQSKIKYIRIIEKAVELGIEGVILGCTEIPLLIKDSDIKLPVFDTTYIHAEAAVKFSITQ